MWHTLRERILNQAMVLRGLAVFHADVRRPLPAIAGQLFSTPASDAERAIKIIQAVLGEHSCQMSIATLIAGVLLAMPSL
jgi:hypothetical protein